MNYIEIIISKIEKENKELLIALISEYEHNGILEEEEQLKVYFPADSFPEDEIKEICHQFSKDIEINTIIEKNWNEQWEKDFEPVIIDSFCGIRADFHLPLKQVEHELIVTPKMSFGTGHHATTYLMIKMMSGLDFVGKSVLDFGCGTGVLAILAEKMGATQILAIDNDEWAVENTEENILRNACNKIQVNINPIEEITDIYDIILANINRNILLRYMELFPKLLNPKGKLLLSGILFEEDYSTIKKSAQAVGLNFISVSNKEKWAAMLLEK